MPATCHFSLVEWAVLLFMYYLASTQLFLYILPFFNLHWLLYHGILWATIGVKLSDAKLTNLSPGRKGPSWHPMQWNAYFSVMEPMGTWATGYGTLRTGNGSREMTWSLMKTLSSQTEHNPKSARESILVSLNLILRPKCPMPNPIWPTTPNWTQIGKWFDRRIPINKKNDQGRIPIN